MPTTIKIAVFTNSDDAFVAWAPSEAIPGCLGFRLERGRKKNGSTVVEEVQNRVGFERDHPRPGDQRPSSQWPFQRLNWTDHAVDVGHEVRYRVTAMVDNGSGGPFQEGPSSAWTPWAKLSADAGAGFSCYFNRGLAISQFVARYMKAKGLTPAKFKAQLKKRVDPKFRAFLEGDLGVALDQLLADSAKPGAKMHAALYELGDSKLEEGLIVAAGHVNLILANGSDKAGDGNEEARQNLNDNGVPTIDRLLKSKGLGHNKFVVLSKSGRPKAVWTGSTNWSTTGLCTQINNALLVQNEAVAKSFLKQWEALKDASPPKTNPANFPDELVAANDVPTELTVGGAKVEIWFTRTSDGQDMARLRELIAGARESILFLMFTPGKDGLHKDCAQRAGEEGMYVRGVVSTLGNTGEDNARNFLDVSLIGGPQAKRARFSVAQPQGLEADFASWLGEITRRNFLSQVGHAIVHSKVLVIDALSANPVVVTGSHNFSSAASARNDENFVIVRGHKKLAAAYATNIMSVYQHYRFRSYVREMEAAGKKPFSKLSDNDRWLRQTLRANQLEINHWVG